MDTADVEEQPSRTIDGRYQVVREIGAGGMGVVYEARHIGTGKRVAVKVIHKRVGLNDTTTQRFSREAKAAGQLESQHIPQVFDLGVDEETGEPYMAMELLIGEDLSVLLKRLGPLPPDLAVRIAAQAARGLARAHENGVVHRDIKAANIFIADRDDGEVVVKILDFGIAKVKPAEGPSVDKLTQTGAIMGSPFYMSPEQARGRNATIDHRSDIWSLGIALYEMLVGKSRYDDIESFGELVLVLCREPCPSVQDDAPWVDPALALVLARSVEIAAEDRYQSADAMYEALVSLLPDRPRIQKTMLTPLPEAFRGVVAERAPEGTMRPGDTVDETLTGARPGDAQRAAAANTLADGTAAAAVAVGAADTLVVGTADRLAAGAADTLADGTVAAASLLEPTTADTSLLQTADDYQPPTHRRRGLLMLGLAAVAVVVIIIALVRGEDAPSSSAASDTAASDTAASDDTVPTVTVAATAAARPTATPASTVAAATSAQAPLPPAPASRPTVKERPPASVAPSPKKPADKLPPAAVAPLPPKSAKPYDPLTEM